VAKFDALETQILGISVDSPFANKRFAEDLGISYPLLSDFHRTVSRLYGVLDEERGVARRTTFVIDRQGIIRYIEQGASAIDPTGAYRACQIMSGKKEP